MFYLQKLAEKLLASGRMMKIMIMSGLFVDMRVVDIMFMTFLCLLMLDLRAPVVV